MKTITDFKNKYNLSADQKCFWFSSFDLVRNVLVFKAVFGLDVCDVEVEPDYIRHKIHDVYPVTALSMYDLKPDKIVVRAWNDSTCQIDVTEYEGCG